MMGKKKLFFMVCLLAVAFGLTGLVVLFAEKKKETDNLLCVTSFYPVQLLAEAVSDGAEGVTVRNLTENHSGCIHDYTLTTQDMRLLSEAELFLINGGDLELFLEKAAAEYKRLLIVDTSEGYAFLEGVEHTHETEAHEDREHRHESSAENAAAHATQEHAINAHLWLDIDGYLLQLARVEEAFVKADPAQATLYRRNAEMCRGELLRLKEEYEAAKELLSGKETVVFHEGFVYLLKQLGIEPIHCLAMDSDTQLAAGEAAEIMEECKLHGITVLFAEQDYAEAITDTFGRELSAEVVVLDPITDKPEAGNRDGGAMSLYCNRMRSNLDRMKQAYGLR